VRRGVMWLSAAVALGLPVAAFAGALPGAPGMIAGGAAPVSACDTAFGHTYTTVSGNVTSVLVTGIADPACEGGQLSLTLTDAAGTALGSGGPVTIPTDANAADNSAAVSLAPTPDGDVVAGIRIAISGP
jgi:hypothetical protein